MTKENYEDAIMRMYNFCISSNHPEEIREQFYKDLDFLAKLAEEHFEEKQETNLERYYDDLLEEGFSDFAVVNGKIESCPFISCEECEFESGNCRKDKITWLTSKCKKRKHKFTQFEYDLIDTYRGSSEICKFHNCYQLRRLKAKGYFNDVDKNESIKDILENCEVIKDENC